ncbi:FAD-binding oxidoreductase [Gluconacetobacter takamatsuzukensis]|uniref:FAD-binding oxidoreductase n=1 Tax=Gluconacetobacter takamatsuzukensis TaxID=1286190 RepID=A0A7W4PPK4_9PROT|nr:FAD-binding oxidoreductase [Gluconacetobacter takamatsuzukensis]
MVGGGIVGRACALRLLACGLDVALVDPRCDPPPPSWGNAGHIACEQTVPLAGPGTLRDVPRRLYPRGPLDIGWRHVGTWLPWTLRFLACCTPGRARAGTAALRGLMADALPAWQRLAADLGRPDLLSCDGTIKLWEDARTMPGAPPHADPLTGVAATPLPPAQLAAFAAALQVPPAAGRHYGRTAHVTDITALLHAMESRFIARGGIWRATTATHLRPGRHGTAVHLADGTILAPDLVLVSGGIGTRALLARSGMRVPLIAERGYHVEWDHGGVWTLPNVVFEDRALVVTRFGPRLRATSFVEFTRDDAPFDPRKWQILERHVAQLGLPVASPFARWAGARPTLPDYLPAIGRLGTAPGLHAAFGHNHLGLTLAAATAEALVPVMTGAPLPPRLHPFRPDRF